MFAHTCKTNRSAGMQRWLCLLALLAFYPPPAYCQRQRFEVATDYSYLRANSSHSGGSFNAHGGSASVAWNITPQVGVTADFGEYQFGGQPTGVDGRMFTYAFGPRISPRSERGVWSPFGQFLIGGARLSGNLNGQPAAENGFATIVGGGVDARVRPRIAIRCIEVDYVMTRFERSSGTPGVQNDLRISTGIVFHF